MKSGIRLIMMMIDEAFKKYMNNVYKVMNDELMKVKGECFPDLSDEEFASLITMEIVEDDLVRFRFKEDIDIKGLANIVFLEFELFSVEYDENMLMRR